MKKLSIIVLFICMCLPTLAQELKLGPKIGATLSRQGFDSEYQVWKPGIEFGILANLPMTERIYLQAEFLITQKGYKEKFGDTDVFDQLTMTYWQLPVIAQYRGGFKIEYFANLGFYAARWQSGSYRSRISSDNEIVENQYEFTSDYNVEGFKDNRMDFGVIAGGGIILPISINHLMLDVRYNHGFTDTIDLEVEPDGYVKHNNQSISISLTLLFYL